MSTETPSIRRSVLRRNLLLLQFSYIGLLLLIAVKTLLWPPADKQVNWIVFLIQIIPLLPFIYGVFRAKRRHIASLCYVLLVYFIAIGQNIFSPLADIYTWLGLGFIAAIYVTAMLHVRWTRTGVIIHE